MQVKAETLFTFLSQYAALPVPGAIAAYFVGYAEFVLPVMLVLGFGTRIAALGLLIMTAMIQVFVLPEALWTHACLLGCAAAGAVVARPGADFASITSSAGCRAAAPSRRRETAP